MLMIPGPPSAFFENAHDTAPCARGWHLRHTLDGEPVYFRRAGGGRMPHYVFGPAPSGERTKLLECAPDEGPWLCEACGTFVVTESCRIPPAPARET